MKKEFIPYEQAVALKEMGFNEICLAMYTIVGLELFSQRGYVAPNGGYTNIELSQDSVVGAPLYQQAFRWFREKYNLHHVITIKDLGKFETGSPDFQCAIYSKDPVSITNMDNYSTYEEAEFACLEKLIEIAKEKK